MRSLLALFRILLAAVLFVLAVAAVSPVPIPAAAPLTLIATEWGHLWCVAAVGVLCSGIGDARGAASFVLASASLLLLSSPVLRATMSPDSLGVWTLADVYRTEVSENPSPTAVEHLSGHTLSLFATDTRGDRPSPVLFAVASRDGTTSSIDTYLPWLRSLNKTGYHVVAVDWPKDAHPSVDTLPFREWMNWVRVNADTHKLSTSRIALIGLEAAAKPALDVQDASLVGRIVWSPTTEQSTDTAQEDSHPTLVLCPERTASMSRAPCHRQETSKPANAREQFVSLSWATRDGLSQAHGPTASVSRNAVATFLKQTFARHTPLPEAP